MLGARRLQKDPLNARSLKTKGAAPDSIDWREKSIVNAVKDQGQCGSCWAFSAIQAQESQYALIFGTLQSLSESNLVDCAWECKGCNGGWPWSGYDHVIVYQKGKFMLEDDYPYQPVTGTCQFDASKGVQTITGYIEVDESEVDLKEKV